MPLAGCRRPQIQPPEQLPSCRGQSMSESRSSPRCTISPRILSTVATPSRLVILDSTWPVFPKSRTLVTYNTSTEAKRRTSHQQTIEGWIHRYTAWVGYDLGYIRRRGPCSTVKIFGTRTPPKWASRCSRFTIPPSIQTPRSPRMTQPKGGTRPVIAAHSQSLYGASRTKRVFFIVASYRTK